jgi:hypothetical protein
MTEIPAATIQRAAELMRKRAEEATPGPWERPLDTRTKSAVIAPLPDDEKGSYLSGTIPAEFASHKGPTGRYAGQRERVGVVSASTWSGGGGFTRKRSGRDLEHIASWHPLAALAVASWLESLAGIEFSEDGPRLDEWAWALHVARVYLGEEDGRG